MAQRRKMKSAASRHAGHRVRPGNTTQAEATARMFRQFLVDSRFRPGDKLPSVSDLERRFGVGRTVVQQAAAQLRDEGSITTIDRKGIFLADHPPHLFRIAVAFRGRADESDGSGIVRALREAVSRRQAAAPERRLDFSWETDDPTSSAYRRLLDEAARHLMRGIMLVTPTERAVEDLRDRATWTRAVVICPGPPPGPFPVVGTNGWSFWEKAFAWLRDRKRRRLAILGCCDSIPFYREVIARTGARVHGPWIQGLVPGAPEMAEQVVSLLMDRPARQRPDGIVVADDGVLDVSLRALGAAGIRIGEDLDVLTHCNWPNGKTYPAAVERLGYDARDILGRASGVLASPGSQSGTGGAGRKLPGSKDRASPQCQYVDALFEHELADRSARPASP